MTEGKKNVVGDLVMSLTICCATVVAFLFLCAIMWVTVKLFVIFINSENI